LKGSNTDAANNIGAYNQYSPGNPVLDKLRSDTDAANASQQSIIDDRQTRIRNIEDGAASGDRGRGSGSGTLTSAEQAQIDQYNNEIKLAKAQIQANEDKYNIEAAKLNSGQPINTSDNQVNLNDPLDR
jgi:hypothetical protein